MSRVVSATLAGHDSVREPLPSPAGAGTERVVSYLTEELVHQGHDVTLFASGDSDTDARLVPVAHRSLRLDKHCIDETAHHVLLLERVHQRASEFDVVHVQPRDRGSG